MCATRGTQAQQPVCEDSLQGWSPRTAALLRKAVDPKWLVVRVEAMRCADVGPLLVRRSHFVEVGGLNESGTSAGEPSSVRVDCDLQARQWLRGYAALALGLVGGERWAHGEAQRAWEHPKMAAGHARRVAQYYERFERPGSAARRAIEAAARRMNDNFRCPRERLRRQPRTKFDCLVTEAEGTCVA